MDPRKDEQHPLQSAQSMMQQATAGLGIPEDTVGLNWPRKPLNGRAMGAKKGGKSGSRPAAKGRTSHRAMRSSKSHPPKKYQSSPIGWE